VFSYLFAVSEKNDHCGGVSKNVTQQFLLVISIVRFIKNVTWGGGGLKSAKTVSRII
jgi:hypothetical protein